MFPALRAPRPAVLCAAGLLDAPVPALDRLARLAARLLEAPVALVSLADGRDQVVLGAAGPVARPDGPRRAPLRGSICERVTAAGAPLVVTDAWNAARTGTWNGTRAGARAGGERPVGDPALSGLGVGACAAFPLRGPGGEVLGALCAVDTEPREWDRNGLESAEDVAAMAETEIASRLATGEALLSARRLRGVLDRVHDAFVSIDATGAVTEWNPAATRLFGWSREEAVGRPVSELIVPPRLRPAYHRGLRRILETGGPTLAGRRTETAAVDRDGREFPVELAVQADLGHGEPVFHAFLHDIGARRAVREQLERDRTFLAALLDGIEAGVAACDADGRIALFNRAMREIHHVTEQPLDARDWAGTYHLFAPDGHTLLRPEEVPLARAFAGEQVEGSQVVVAVPGFPPRRFLANGRPIDTPDGRRLGAVVVMHDITGRHRAEVMRAVQQDAAEALADAATAEEAAAGVVAAIAGRMGWACGEYWHADPGGNGVTRLVSWTAPGRDLSAFTGDERVTFGAGVGLPGLVQATGRDVWIRDLPSDPLGFVRREAAARAGLHTAAGLPVRGAQGLLGVLAFFAERVEEPGDDLGTLLDGVCAHLGRHLERRRAEELALALETSRRHIDQIVSQLSDFMWTYEITGGVFRRVHTSSDASGMFGAPLPEGTDLVALMFERIHPEDRAAAEAYMDELVAGRPAETEFRIVGLDGVTRWVWPRARPRREGGRLFVDGIATDVTEQHRLAEERERLLAREQAQVDRLRDLDRMKDELVAVVSHELRSPIGAIRGYVEMLLDDLDPAAGRRALIDVADRESGHLQRLTDDLLDLARFDAGRAVIDPRPVPLDRLVRTAVGDHRPEGERGRLTLTAEAAEPLTVHADPVRLRQVLDNLLSNAIRYTPEGGAVLVTAGREGDEAVVTVADTGIGIPAEQYPQLFTRFFRASTAREAGTKGTGLGLAITKAIVEAHGGVITAAPREGGGTVLTVRLPAAPPGQG
ncbi:PAS domain S-box protein [Planomonospora corallina]|uniref:Sensor-like histidine kinase SenX3 n=1 Tax=Planomonospora corallina TaxID=1806052 RepID=A0ABV8IEE3_9ACTN